MTWQYMQRKMHQLAYPMSFCIGEVFTKHVEDAAEGSALKNMFAVHKQGEIVWYSRKEDIENSKKNCVKLVLEEPDKAIGIVKVFRDKAPEFLGFCKSLDTDHSGKRYEELLNLYNQYVNRYIELYPYSEPFAWHTKEGVDEALLKTIPKDDLLTMIAPPISFVRREEMDLLRVDGQRYTIEEHTKRYFWIPYDYGVKVWTEEHFREQLKDIKNPQEKLMQMEEQERNLRKAQKALTKSLDDKTRRIVLAVRELGFVMDYKKEVFTRSHYYIHLLMDEIARRLDMTRQDVEFIQPMELGRALSGEPDKKKTHARYRLCVQLWKDGSYELLEPEEAEEFIKENLPEEIREHSDEILGTPAYPGTYRGRVRKITDSRQIDTLEQGEVLVTYMTSPDYTIGMKKAGAIITDEGGVTCHAAIVSRELKKPCIVGTRIATRILKTGDIVEVDSEKGTVKVIR